MFRACKPTRCRGFKGVKGFGVQGFTGLRFSVLGFGVWGSGSGV